MQSVGVDMHYYVFVFLYMSCQQLCIGVVCMKSGNTPQKQTYSLGHKANLSI